MKKLNVTAAENIQGGVTRDEYCNQQIGWFQGMVTGDFDYQGDVGWFMQNFFNNCGSYGYTLW